MSEEPRPEARPDRTCVYCGRAWRFEPGVWVVTGETPDCEHETLTGLT